MKIGARNQLVGEVVDIKKGAMMAMVKVRIPAESAMASIHTIDSLENLGIKVGDRVLAVVKAINVLLIKE